MGPGGEAGDGGVSAGGAADEEAAGGPPTIEPPSCRLDATWSNPEPVTGVSSAGSEVLLSLTPDELNLAFLRGETVYVAHRSQLDAAFELGAPVAVPAGWTATQGAALSADGKRLILLSDPDQKRLGELTRTSRSGAFSDTIDVTAFVEVNQDSEFTGRVYASPTVSAGDDQLVFNSALQQTSTVVVSTRTGSGWSRPARLATSVLDSNNGKRRLPTGLSADARTLFYFNEETAEEEARWRVSASEFTPLYDMRSLGARRAAVANSACDRLYSAQNGDVVVEAD